MLYIITLACTYMLQKIQNYPLIYFGYGSNMNHDQMSFRCPTARFLKPYWLRGWELAFGSHATIVPQRGARVPGALWEITVDDLQALDAYEGYPSYYTRRRWRQDDEYFFFYEMCAPVIGAPSAGYIKGIAQGYNDCGLALDYLNHHTQQYHNDYI